MTLYVVGSVVNANGIRASRMQMAPGKHKLPDAWYGNPLGLDAAGVVAAENLASAGVMEMARWATAQALGEGCDADRRAVITDSVRRVTELYILAVLDCLRVGVPPRSPQLPAGLFDFIRDAARQKVALYYFLRALRIASPGIVVYVSGASEVAEGCHYPSVRSGRIWDVISAYTENFSARIAQVYVAEEGQQSGGLPAARERLVTDVIAQRPVDQADAERILGINLAHHHLAVVLWALPGTEVSSEQLDRFAVELARALDSRRPLIMPSGPARAWMWIWISWPRPPEDGLVAQVCKTLSPPPQIRASIGPVAAGLTGFRRSHLCAQAAARVASAGDRGSSWFYDYADVAVVSLVTSDPQQARWFVEETLGALGLPGRRLAELRETLRVYLAVGRSRMRAAERLHVARNTVAYRVDKAGNLLGRQISEDELRVRLALEIARILPSES